VIVAESGLLTRGLATRAGSFELLGVDLEVAADRVLVVLGPSGAGKTMLLHTIAGFRQATAGEVLLNGRDLSRLVPEQRRIGFVFQDAALFPHLSARENVNFALRARKETRPDRVDELMERFGIRGLAERFPRSLSGGERQRVALARALASEPDLLLLDEPLSALDQPTREELRAVMEELLRGLGIPAIHVTHDRDEAFSLADDLVVIVDGKVRQTGEAHQVAAKPVDSIVARLLGWAELGRGEVIRGKVAIGPAIFEAGGLQGAVHVLYRPEDVRLGRVDEGTRASLGFTVRVQRIARTIPLARVTLGPEPRMTVLMLRREIERLDLKLGQEIEVLIPPEALCVVAATKN
jgi:ABC-type Fe3+/spermidine/putrescine transport system ATPase subunit